MSKAIDKIVIKVGNYLCRKRNKKPFSTIGQLIKSLAFMYENHNYDIHKNGERRVIDIMSRFRPKVVVDAGANVGEWTILASGVFKDAHIYAFEIVPSTFQILETRCSHLKNISVFNVGLDEEPGTVELNIVHDKHGSNSAYPRDKKKSIVTDKISCEVTTIDAHLLKYNVQRIDFLKIDTEGMDYRVLKGAKNLLASEAISVIQFEYGMVAVDTGFLLKDFHKMLQGYGYAVGKMYPTYVDFRDYHRSMEDFIGPNFLAVRRELKDHIQAFANF